MIRRLLIIASATCLALLPAAMLSSSAGAVAGSAIQPGQSPVASRLTVGPGIDELPTCNASTASQVVFSGDPPSIVLCDGDSWVTAQYFFQSVVSTTSASAAATTRYINSDAAGAATQIDLPNCSNRHGMVVSVKKVDATGNHVTVVSSTPQTIDGDSNRVLTAQWDHVTFVCGNCLADGDDNWCVH